MTTLNVDNVFHQVLKDLNVRGSSTNISKAWEVAKDYIHPETLTLPHPPPSNEVIEAFEALRDSAMIQDLVEWYFLEVSQRFEVVNRMLNSSLSTWENDGNIYHIFSMIQGIAEWVSRYQQPLIFFGSDQTITQQYHRLVQSLLFPNLPHSFVNALRALYVHLLSSPHVQVIDELAFLGLLDRFMPVLFALVYEQIEEHIDRTYRGVWDIEGVPQTLKHWLNSVLGNWIKTIYGKSTSGDHTSHSLKPAFSRFDYHIQKTLCELRASELFDIIVDFPTSVPALNDLKYCLDATDSRQTIVSALIWQNSKRLLHPGAETKDIITQYISMIKSLRILDPQGVLLSRVTEPVRSYLRSRNDTIRCIVSSLIEEGSELSEEVDSEEGLGKLDTGKDDVEDYLDPSWTPIPVDAPPNFRTNKGSDILQMLVSIYDSKDLFVKELQVLLAQRLLAVKNYELDKEIRNIEILKIRFGETTLQSCEVMLKDLVDSKRSDVGVHKTDPNNPTHCIIVSRLFWPPFQRSSLRLGPQLDKFQKSYSRSFTKMKPEKKLAWIPQLGTTRMNIELQDRTLEVDATPFQASILEHFGDKEFQTIEEIMEKINVDDKAQVRNGLYFWANHGVLGEINDENWKLLEVSEKVEDTQHHVVEDTEPAVETTSVQEHQIEQMRVLWAFIRGMLTNLGASPTDKVHTMLSKFVPDYKGRTQEELQAFLETMEKEGALERVGTNWKLIDK